MLFFSDINKWQSRYEAHPRMLSLFLTLNFAIPFHKDGESLHPPDSWMQLMQDVCTSVDESGCKRIVSVRQERTLCVIWMGSPLYIIDEDLQKIAKV